MGHIHCRRVIQAVAGSECWAAKIWARPRKRTVVPDWAYIWIRLFRADFRVRPNGSADKSGRVVSDGLNWAERAGPAQTEGKWAEPLRERMNGEDEDGRRGGFRPPRTAVPASGCRGDGARGRGRWQQAPPGLRRARDGRHGSRHGRNRGEKSRFPARFSEISDLQIQSPSSVFSSWVLLVASQIVFLLQFHSLSVKISTDLAENRENCDIGDLWAGGDRGQPESAARPARNHPSKTTDNAPANTDATRTSSYKAGGRKVFEVNMISQDEFVRTITNHIYRG
ncbi:hypothetical protein CRG98_000958 [Punica granatum]|uniref:Uncharacterized protein n=1 Tax=Punica granatum TaxID=22663 RepID=A0A2I0LD29_PUNGR|nr:hypothetical protein CRG98_000958 [Punica granatum]